MFVLRTTVPFTDILVAIARIAIQTAIHLTVPVCQVNVTGSDGVTAAEGSDNVTVHTLRPRIGPLLLVPLVAVFGKAALAAPVAERARLSDSVVRVTWSRKDAGWSADAVEVKERTGWKAVGVPLGEYTVLFSEAQPDPKQVPLNTVGVAYRFFPQSSHEAKGIIQFAGACDAGDVTSDWYLDPGFPGDIRVSLTLTARKRGYYSLSTPTLTRIGRPELSWGMIPGYWQGTGLQPDFDLAYKYGQGIPDKPVIVRERTATTLAPLLTSRLSGGTLATLAAVPDPGTGRDPFEADHLTQNTWRLGLSMMDRAGNLSPTLYAPVLGQTGSLLEPGQTVTLRFRYCLRSGEWPAVYTHAARDIYRFSDGLALKQPQQHSLSQRMKLMQAYVGNSATSLWQTDSAGGSLIGAQSYLGGVKGASRGEAMKNSDLGAMWMLARITGDPLLAKDRLPLVRSFKLAQQQTEPGFFQGAALGQYWLRDQNKFAEEWGPYVEPIGLTYYTLIDLGNILLFTPNDPVLRDRLRIGAETLLRWQKPDGSWDVAYRREAPHGLAYPKLTDLRPTWYGLLVAYRILGDRRYLDAARRGADWFLVNAVAPGHYLGVCGDSDFVMDFATGQSAQCLLDLAATTGDRRYREAAIRTARLYWTWTFTHPIPTAAVKSVKGVPRADWEITQAGLSMEHGGTHGSANGMGPIMLCSHAGMFVRMYETTKEPLFLEMARYAALGRDAFVDPKSGVASYYWRAMNAGPGPYPHHAWWQFGWIMDYLLAESHLRTGGRIDFPRGFVTPKVGPQQSVGFAPGTVYGSAANLWMPPGLLSADSPSIDTLGALSPDGKTLYVVVLSEHHAPIDTIIRVDSRFARADGGTQAKITGMRTLSGSRLLPAAAGPDTGSYRVHVDPYGVAVLAFTVN
jgi:hypothetical protein